MSLPPPHPPPETPDPSAIEQAAAEWILRHERGLTEAEKAEFSRWIAADARHAPMYSALEETLALLHVAQREAAADAASRRPQIRPVAAATAEPRLVRLPAWSWASVAAIAAAIALGFFLWPRFAVPSSAAPDPAAYQAEFSTAVGWPRTHTLPDGSKIRLNTDSQIEVRYGSATRNVRLVKGEAHFEVAKEPGRPFIVAAGSHRVQAVGTAFNVHLRTASVEVLVTEGRVKVDSAPTNADRDTTVPPTPILVAGQKLVLPREASLPISAAPTDVTSAQIAQDLAWREGRLEFTEATLAEIVAEMNRYSSHQLVIADPRLAGKPFGGTFPIGNHDLFVRLLERNFGIVAERTGNETRLRLAP